MKNFFSANNTFDLAKNFTEFSLIGAHSREIFSVMAKADVWKLHFILCQYIYGIVLSYFSQLQRVVYGRAICVACSSRFLTSKNGIEYWKNPPKSQIHEKYLDPTEF